LLRERSTLENRKREFWQETFKHTERRAGAERLESAEFDMGGGKKLEDPVGGTRVQEKGRAGLWGTGGGGGEVWNI